MAFSSFFSPSNINGRNGFILDAGNRPFRVDRPIDIIGDINSDGIDDVVVNAPGAGGGDFALAGSYVVFGRTTGFEKAVDLGALDGSNGFALSEFVGIPDDVNGRGSDKSNVSAAGDFNGDGIEDLLVSAAQDSFSEDPSSGNLYVVFGRDTGFEALESLTDLSSSEGVVVSGLGSGRPTASSAGDINNDGLDDIVIGTENESYVIFGTTAGVGTILAPEELNGSNGFVFESGSESVSNAEDFDGDGIDDLIIGNPKANPDPESAGDNGRGESYVILGRDTGFEASVTRADLEAGAGFVIKGFDINGNSGRSVSNAGDVNGDGFDDVAVGAPTTGQFSYDSRRFGQVTRAPGAAYVVFGRAAGSGASIELSELDGSNGFVTLATDGTGTDVSDAGDLNGDGFDDVAISTGVQFFTGYSSTYVVFGKETGFDAEIQLPISGDDVLKISEQPPSTGGDLAGGGDVNGDGIDDLAVFESDNAYVIFGQDEASDIPTLNQSPANIYVGTDGRIVGDAFGTGEIYQGSLFSNTDGSINPNDVIIGTAGNDNIWAGTQGDDSISSGAGDDLIGISDGDARVEAGSGDDFVYAIGDGDGRNVIDLGDGNDNYYALAGDNGFEATSIRSSSGNNTIAVGSGVEQVATGDGDDFVYDVGGVVNNFSDTLILGAGDNTVWLQTGNYGIFTEEGDDIVGLGIGEHRVVTDGGNDVVYMANSAAVEGDNDIETEEGDDYIQSGAGDDILSGGLGSNTIFGGAGSDVFKVDLEGFVFIGDFEAGIDSLRDNGFRDGSPLLDTAGLTITQGSVEGDRTSNTFIYNSNGSNIAEIANLTTDALFA